MQIRDPPFVGPWFREIQNQGLSEQHGLIYPIRAISVKKKCLKKGVREWEVMDDIVQRIGNSWKRAL
jgi:hypothetical protein